MRIYVDPSEQAWAAVQEVVKDRRAACEVMLNKLDIKEILGRIVDQGFNIADIAFGKPGEIPQGGPTPTLHW